MTGTTGATSEAYRYNSRNQLESILEEVAGYTNQTEFVYDNNGNLCAKLYSRLQSRSGKPHGLGVDHKALDSVVHEYDTRNRLILTKARSGAVVRNQYNGDNFRVARTVNRDRSKYYYSNRDLILEMDDNGGNPVHNLFGSRPVMRMTGSQTMGFVANGHGDVSLLTGADGTLLSRYRYGDYGEMRCEGDVVSPFRYNGYRFDAETGLYDLHNRFYDPATARFLQEDSFLGFATDPLSLHRYTYSRNNPFYYYDEDGNLPVPVIAGLVNAGIRLAVDLITDSMNGELKSWYSYVAGIGVNFISGAVSTFNKVGSIASLIIDGVYDALKGKLTGEYESWLNALQMALPMLVQVN